MWTWKNAFFLADMTQMSAREHCLLRQQSNDYFNCNVDLALGQVGSDEADASGHFVKQRGNVEQEDFSQYLNEPVSVATVCQPMTGWIPRYYYAKKADEYSAPANGYGHNGQAIMSHPHGPPTQFINSCYPVSLPDHRYAPAAFALPFQESLDCQPRPNQGSLPSASGWAVAPVLPDCS